MTSHRSRKRHVSPLPLILLLAGILLAWGLYGIIIILYPFEGDFWDARGKFGDMFGAFNALFTACAFAALIYGIRLEYKHFAVRNSIQRSPHNSTRLSNSPPCPRRNELPFGVPLSRHREGPATIFPLSEPSRSRLITWIV